jgi:D-alanyl-D-alanine carboxypeptidase
MCGTKRPIRQARAIHRRRPRQLRTGRLPRVPLVALLLSFLVFLSPELTLAPLQAVEPDVRLRPIDEASLPLVPHVQPRQIADQRSAGPLQPASVQLADGPRYSAALEAARELGSAYGVTFAVVRDGTLVWAGSAGRARDGRTELTPDSALVIGSVTKTFVAATIMELAEEGRIDLDESARTHLRSLHSLSPKITIRQLLGHTSGLADVFNDTTRVGIEEHPEHAWSTDELLASLHAPWYQPGENWAYANTNYYLLSLVIEQVTGASLTDELQRRFIGPLGLERTRILSPTDPAGPLEPAWTTIFWGSGAMTASAADLARWGDALYGDGILNADSRAEMLRFNDHDYGLGAQRIELPGADGYGHTGLLNTYTTLLWHFPGEEVTIALEVNRSHVDLGAMVVAEPPGGPSLLELATGIEPPEPTPSPSPSPSPSH